MTDTLRIRSFIRQHLEKNRPATGSEILHTRGDRRGGLLRIPLDSQESTVVKIWRIRNLKERIKSKVYFSNAWREWHMHQFIHQAGVQAPVPIDYFRLSLPKGDTFECMAIEDLGETERGLPYLKRLIANNDESKAKVFEKGLVDITLDLIKLGVLDIDHQLNNFLVDSNDRLVRIDFECARRYWMGFKPKGTFAEMIARLLASHVYAVQPNVSRTERFAERLYRRLDIDHRMQARVQCSVDEKLERQYRTMGIRMTVTLPK